MKKNNNVETFFDYFTYSVGNFITSLCSSNSNNCAYNLCDLDGMLGLNPPKIQQETLSFPINRIDFSGGVQIAKSPNDILILNVPPYGGTIFNG